MTLSFFASRVALVTGAASGLGRATAERFVKLGGKVVLVDLASSKGAEVAAALGPSAAFAAADVTSEADVLAAVALAMDRFGKLNVAVSCAGVGIASRVLGKKGPHPLDLFTKARRRRRGAAVMAWRRGATRVAARRRRC